MELICFDLDDTLVKANRTHVIAFKKAFKKNMLPKKTSKEILKQFSQESSVLVQKLYPTLTKKQRETVVQDHDYFVITQTAKYMHCFPRVKETLKKLKKKYKIAILSNAKHKEICATLQHVKIKENYFDLIIGNDDVTHPKPAPDEMIKAEQLLKIKKGYMVGDSIYDVRAGNKAGLKTIAVLTGNHSRKELKKEKPWKIIKSLKELPKILEIFK